MKSYEVELDGKTLTIEHGLVAEQANAAVTVRLGDTVVFVSVCMDDPRPGIDFFPLTVDYEERLYAIGRIPGSFPRREGRATNEGILAMRLTDRPLRPLFPKDFRNEVQVVAMTLSGDGEHQPDSLITVGASAALMISNIPFNGPVSSVRVAKVGDRFITNPTFAESDEGDMDIIVAGTDDAVVMVEAGAKEVPEDTVLEAIETAMEANRAINAVQRQMAEDNAPVKAEYTPTPDLRDAVSTMEEHLADRLEELVATAASERSDENKALRKELAETFEEQFSEAEIGEGLFQTIKKAMRAKILSKGERADGRSLQEIRPLNIQVGLLPRTHGSGLFQRGQTQVLSIATLGPLSMKQKLDTLSPDETKRYMHHYNFPPFSVGEVRPMRGPGRREIGHGALAERALEAVIPDQDTFPYTIRVVSEVLSSNGSTSMASVCGSTLSLMDAGVPVASPVAGIAMGLIMGEDGNYAVLTDIAGQEDFMGDMDFKVAGTKDGITALQMDIKITGVSRELLSKALSDAREARETLLEKMAEVLPSPRDDVSEHAPKVIRTQVNPEQIGLIIGPGGKTIRKIQEESGGATIDIEEDGSVFIGGTTAEVANKALAIVEGMTKEVEVGEIYTGKVQRVINIGAFVEFLPGKEGLVHISQLSDSRVERVEDVCNVGDEMTVMVTEVDGLGRINLSRRAILKGESPEDAAAAAAQQRSDRGDRGDRGGGGPRGGRGGGPRGDRGDRGDRGGGGPGGGRGGG
ncbi:MAG TPA: polyribonucleotide nucleotidyltransferase, partial [Dehalococcoidia bacterium]|nr:polyribonucleotide nucleotidyltransferase [Dehalococcoidia bacterium]